MQDNRIHRLENSQMSRVIPKAKRNGIRQWTKPLRHLSVLNLRLLRPFSLLVFRRTFSTRCSSFLDRKPPLHPPFLNQFWWLHLTSLTTRIPSLGKEVLPLPLLSQLFSQVSATSSSSSGSKRRSSNSQEGSRKLSETICRNWNLGNCEVDLCCYNRRHGECCECNGSHRARDKGECLAALNVRRQQQKAAATAQSSRAQGS